VLGAEPGQQPRDEILGGAHHADRHPPALHAAQSRHGGFGFPEHREDPPRVDQQVFAGRREPHAPARALEERQLHRGFQLLDLHRDRRLREMQLLGRAREARVPGHRREYAQLTQ
jgi:hypothetical protein